MFKNSFRMRGVFGVVLSGLVLWTVSGCGDEKTTPPPTVPGKVTAPPVPGSAASTPAPTPAPTANTTPDAVVSLNGAGSSFAYPMYSKWIYEYQKTHAAVKLNYSSIGSGAGITQFTAGTVDFGGTDGPMNEEQMANFKKARNCNPLHLPSALGAVVLTYKVEGVTEELNFTPETLAGIYLGKITQWNDAALKADNPGVNLPAKDIAVVHRADGSGTTYTFVDYLSKVSPEWKEKVGVGTTVKWPVGLGGKGSEGVMGLIDQAPNSIGYVELAYAIQNKVAYGKVKNAAGKFVKADLASTSAAAAGAAATMPEDFRVSITNAPGDASYPIVTFTWLLVPDTITDPAKKKALVEFIKWGLSNGQDFLEPLSYARVPKEVLAKELAVIEKIK